MTIAICYHCGKPKHGALVECRACEKVPQGEEQVAQSLALTDHFHSLERLEVYGREIAAGRLPSLDPRLVSKIAGELAVAPQNLKNSLEFFGSELARKQRRFSILSPSTWFKSTNDEDSHARSNARKSIPSVLMTDEESSPVFIDVNAPDIPILLRGQKRSVKTSTILLSAILLIARKNGWRGAASIFDEHGNIPGITRSHSNTIVSQDEAVLLGKIISALGTGHLNNPEAEHFLNELLALCREGEFRIVVGQS